MSFNTPLSLSSAVSLSNILLFLSLLCELVIGCMTFLLMCLSFPWGHTDLSRLVVPSLASQVCVSLIAVSCWFLFLFQLLFGDFLSNRILSVAPNAAIFSLISIYSLCIISINKGVCCWSTRNICILMYLYKSSCYNITRLLVILARLSHLNDITVRGLWVVVLSLHYIVMS